MSTSLQLGRKMLQDHHIIEPLCVMSPLVQHLHCCTWSAGRESIRGSVAAVICCSSSHCWYVVHSRADSDRMPRSDQKATDDMSGARQLLSEDCAPHSPAALTMISRATATQTHSALLDLCCFEPCRAIQSCAHVKAWCDGLLSRTFCRKASHHVRCGNRWQPVRSHLLPSARGLPGRTHARAVLLRLQHRHAELGEQRGGVTVQALGHGVERALNKGYSSQAAELLQ